MTVGSAPNEWKAVITAKERERMEIGKGNNADVREERRKREEKERL
jgi:hypothetical protein